MNTSHSHDPERLLDLLAEDATSGLSEAEAAELTALLGSNQAERDAWGTAAAAVALALIPPRPTELPAGLRAKLEHELHQQSAESVPQVAKRIATPVWTWLGWVMAASLLMVLFVREFAWVVNDPRTIDNSPVAMRERLLAEAPSSLILEGSKLPNETTTGDVVWNHERQEGYLRLNNLPELQNKQLQLWIFDKERDAKFPVDGGVFDTTTGEVVIPIRAKLQVKEATAFAITVEPPGGVVVSDRERIVWLAKAEE